MDRLKQTQKLSKLRISEIVNYARDYDIIDISSMSKQELIFAIIEKEKKQDEISYKKLFFGI